MINYPDTFVKMPPANYDGVFDWDFLIPAFTPTKIMPMDIDAVVERHGKILIFETKNPGKEIPLGQQITLETFIRIGKGDIHVIIIYGKTVDTIVAMDEWYWTNKGIITAGIRQCDAYYVLDRVTKWFEFANKNISA